MKKSSLKISILLTSLATVLWFAGSWWHYSCNIKNTCGSNQTFAANDSNKDTSVQNVASSDKPATTQVIDTDGDGLSDNEEARLGTDPFLLDTDKDSIPDNEEVGVNLDSPLDSDKDNIIDALDNDDDNDGILTLTEELIGTSSLRADTDDDGIADTIEVGNQPNKPIDTDKDGIINALDTDDDDDGLETSSEILLGTNHLLLDSDADGLSDAKEIGELIGQPIDTDGDGAIDALDTEDDLDQDGDGLKDTLEALLNTDPTKADTDNDGINDDIEIGQNTSKPLDTDLDGIIDALDTVDDTDSDNDTLSDAQEKKLGSDPTKTDSDNDGINDNIEIGENIDNPLDTDNDGILNINDKDDDNDKLSTRYETRIGTNPLSDDTDGDGLKDNVEAKNNVSEDLQDTDNDGKINPVDTDDDNDNVSTLVEIKLGTNPLDPDSDNDGILDAIEIGSNIEAPLDSDKDGTIDALDSIDNLLIAEKTEVNETDPETTKTAPEIIKIDSETAKKEPEIMTTDSETSKTEPEIKETEAVKVADNSDKDINSNEVVDEKSLSLELLGDAREGSIQTSRLYFPFFSSKPVLSNDASNYLKEIVTWMKLDPDNSIILTGHTDNVGKKQANLALGIRRVMVIRDLLIENGAPMSQIDIMSRGESQPIADNSTEQGRLKNRRVEISPM